MSVFSWLARRPFMVVYMLIGVTLYIALLARIESTRKLVTKVEQYQFVAGCADTATPDQCRAALSRMIRLMTPAQARALRKAIQDSPKPVRRPQKERRRGKPRMKPKAPQIRAVAPKPQTVQRAPTPVQAPAHRKRKSVTPAPIIETVRPKRVPQPDDEDPSVDMDQSAEDTQPEPPAGLPEFHLHVDPPPVPPTPVPLPPIPDVDVTVP